jgi:hypothetical protein
LFCAGRRRAKGSAGATPKGHTGCLCLVELSGGKRGTHIGPRCLRACVEVLVPQAPRGQSHRLPVALPDSGLAHKLVAGHLARVRLHLFENLRRYVLRDIGMGGEAAVPVLARDSDDDGRGAAEESEAKVRTRVRLEGEGESEGEGGGESKGDGGVLAERLSPDEAGD